MTRCLLSAFEANISCFVIPLLRLVGREVVLRLSRMLIEDELLPVTLVCRRGASVEPFLELVVVLIKLHCHVLAASYVHDTSFEL